jgi:hypothetical protein
MGEWRLKTSVGYIIFIRDLPDFPDFLITEGYEVDNEEFKPAGDTNRHYGDGGARN